MSRSELRRTHANVIKKTVEVEAQGLAIQVAVLLDRETGSLHDAVVVGYGQVSPQSDEKRCIHQVGLET